MADKKTAVYGIFRTENDAEQTVNRLMAGGFRNDDISVLLQDNKGTRDGWLNRYLAVKGTCDECHLHDASGKSIASPFQAVSMTPQTPRILEGGAASVAMNSVDEFTIRTNGSQADRIEALYRTGNADVVHAAGGEQAQAASHLRQDRRAYTDLLPRLPASRFFVGAAGDS